jgi:hypothetical protein
VTTEAFFSSITGIVAIVMIFGLPIIAILATLIIVMAASRSRHRERMKMIEQGIVPPAPARRRTGNYYALLITGAILFAFGLGMGLVSLISEEAELEPGFIFGSVGLAMLVCFVIIRALNKRRQQEPEHRELPPQA